MTLEELVDVIDKKEAINVIRDNVVFVFVMGFIEMENRHFLKNCGDENVHSVCVDKSGTITIELE